MKIWDRIFALFRRSTPPPGDAPRVLAYCASNIGMGHYVRLLRVLEEVKKQLPGVSILLATDARDNSLTQRLEIAVLQLPRFRFLDQERFKEQPELLNINARELQSIRAELLLSLGRSYRPHVLIADTNPHGKRDELLPLLRLVRRDRGCRKLLLMRDIPSPPGERFKFSGPHAEIRRHADFYDRLLFAGDPGFFDAAKTYGWPEDVRAKMNYLGFVVPPPVAHPREQVLAHYPGLDPARPTFVVSFGGGWQAERFAMPFIEGLALHRERCGTGVSPVVPITGETPVPQSTQMIMSIGPSAGNDLFEKLQEKAQALGGVVVEHFSPHFSQLLLAADFVVLQAGSVPFQVLETDIPILLTHRPYKSREQQERAKRLAQWPGIRLEECDSITAAQCADWIHWGLSNPRKKRETGFSYAGIKNAAGEVITALR